MKRVSSTPPGGGMHSHHKKSVNRWIAASNFSPSEQILTLQRNGLDAQGSRYPGHHIIPVSKILDFRVTRGSSYQGLVCFILSNSSTEVCLAFSMYPFRRENGGYLSSKLKKIVTNEKLRDAAHFQSYSQLNLQKRWRQQETLIRRRTLALLMRYRNGDECLQFCQNQTENIKIEANVFKSSCLWKQWEKFK